ncbi:MAG: methyltransferase domain-containing protein [Oscillospiraceae bacterium]|nr:methyltransferase domain-containing protein [Oscillospiraceae bacterium]
MSELIWSCPVCGENLVNTEKLLKCSNNHCFDKAKSGYVNLLLVQKKHAKLTGDNPAMVRARRDFLSKNYYQNLQEILFKTVKKYLPQNSIILDAGCGEGYYTSKIAKLAKTCYGIDISKIAIDYASRSDKFTHYAVGSLFHLPIQDNSCDMLLNIFAPYCGNEFLRVLKPNAYFIMVIPSAKHLWELKQAIYDKPYENQVKDYQLENFHFCEKIIAENRIFLDHAQDIQNLFQMTPYAYRTGAIERERLQNLNRLEIQTAFEILVYRKEG